MTLSTLTFDQLRDRNDASLDRLRPAPTASVTGATARQRRRIGELLDQRAELEHLASGQDQRQAYGVEAWHRDFVLLREVHAHPLMHLEGKALRFYVWNRMPNSRFKRFQELFCREEQLITPPFTIDASGTVEFGAVDFNTLSLQGCLVSPDRIPEDLAQTLGLCDFANDRGQPLDRLKKKRDAVTHLKKLWESTTSLQDGHHRLLEIGDTPPDTSTRYPDAPAIDPALIGTILYVREKEGGEPAGKKGTPQPPRNRVVQHFSSAYGALRKTDHERKLYDTEMDALSGMKQRLESHNRLLNRDWRKGVTEERKGELRDASIQLLSAVTDALRSCENRFKVRAHDLLEGSITLTDKSGRENISAVMTKMVAAVRELQRRFRELYPKGGFNEQDRMVLHSKISEQELCLKQFRQDFASGASHLQNGFALFNASVAMNPVQLGANVRGVEGHLGDPSALSHVTLEPLRTYAQRLLREHATLHTTLTMRDRNGAMEQAVKMHVIGKFQAARTCIEHIKRFTAHADRIPVSNIREFVTKIRTLCAERELFGERVVEGYVDPFEALCSKLDGIDALLEPYAGQDLAVHQRTALYRTVKEYIDQCDVEAMMHRLP